MREIKFRGKSDKYGWVYGNLSYREEDGNSAVFIEDQGFCGDLTPVDRNTIGQYTGLKDVNGKEIYEGDIITNKSFPYKHIIYYDVAEACFMAKYGPGKDDSCRVYQEWINNCHKQVVGNIHDNPELIKIESKEE